MSVFDFNAEAKEERKNAKCTFTLFRSNETTATPEHPILVLDNRKNSGSTIPKVCLRTRYGRRPLNLRMKTAEHTALIS